jgi:hypothetical protein
MYRGCDVMNGIDLNNVKLLVNFNAVGVDEILQNIKMLFSTPAGTVPFDRDFGINWDIVNKPIVIAKGLLTVEYIEKVRKYEPRAQVKQVTFEYDSISGSLIPKVVINLV